MTTALDAPDANDAPNITGGPAMLTLNCPQCKGAVVFPVTLGVHLSIDDEHSTLRPKLSTKAADHRCARHEQPDLFAVTGDDE